MRSQRGLVWALSILGAGLFSVMFFLHGFTMHEAWDKYIIFLIFMAVSELHTIPFRSSRLSMEFGFVFSAAYIFGPVPAILMKAMSTLIVEIYRYRGHELVENYPVVLYNISQYIISCIGGWTAYIAVINFSGLNDLGLYSTACVVGIVVYFLLNNFLIELYLVGKQNGRLLLKFVESLPKDIMTYLIAVPAGIMMIKAYQLWGFYGTPVVFILFMIVVYIHRIYNNLIATNRQLTALYDVAATMASTLDLDQVMEIVLASLQNIAPWQTACLYVYQKNALVPAIYDGVYDKKFKDTRISLEEHDFGSRLMKGMGEIFNNFQKDNRLTCIQGLPPETKSMMAVPLLTNKELIGAIAVTSNSSRTYNKRHLTLMSILASLAAVAITNAKLFNKTSKMAITDGLTNLYNYRYIFEELKRQVNRVKCTGGMVSMILIDIDRFKTYNDIYGHLIGDEILQNLAKVLKNSVRESDLVGRYGGEEFVVILPGISSDGAMTIAERIRHMVEVTSMASSYSGENIYVTISAGVASYPECSTSVEDLISKADKALLSGAKKDGRNKVVVFDKYMN